MEFFEVVKKRRSVRQFNRDAEVPEEHIHRMLEAAQAAPTAGNTQCPRFFVVRDPKVKKRLASEAAHQLFIDQAPVVVVVAADLDAVGRGYGERGRGTYALQDCAAAAQNILLTATDMGYGTCWVGAFDEVAASKILDLPVNVRPLSIVPVGVPVQPSGRNPPRRKLEEITRFV